MFSRVLVQAKGTAIRHGGSSTLGRQKLQFKEMFNVIVERTKSTFSSTCSRYLSTSSSNKTSMIGFIGLGRMGYPMACNLANNNNNKYKVMVFDSNPSTCQAARDKGTMIVANSVEEMGQSDCSVIFTMLPGCDAVNTVMDKLIQSYSTKMQQQQQQQQQQQKLVVDCSTVSPTTSRRWQAEWSSLCSNDNNTNMIDAPVSGGVKGATDGTLTFMIGCNNAADLEQVRPLLELMGKRIIHCGGPGAGAATKLCNNLALAAQMIGICEAMNLGEALGVDPVVLADVMNTSTAKCWSCEVNNPHPKVAEAKSGGSGVMLPAANDYEGGFGASLMLKDLRLANEAATGVGVSLPLTSCSEDLYQQVDAAGLGGKDFGVMLPFLRRQ